MTRAHTWADGFGIWHADVPRNAASPLIAARRAIRDELLARENIVRRNIWLHPDRAPLWDTADTICYREGDQDYDPDLDSDSTSAGLCDPEWNDSDD